MSETPKRTEKENQLLDQMRKCKAKIDRLEYESDLLRIQDKQEASFKKAHAAELGRQHLKKLSAEYRRIWLKRRKI